MSMNWYSLLSGKLSKTAAVTSVSENISRKPLSEGRGLSVFGDVSGRLVNRVGLSVEDRKALFQAIAGFKASPKSFLLRIAEDSKLQQVLTPSISDHPDVWETYAFKASQVLSVVSDIWLALSFMSFLGTLNETVKSPAIEAGRLALEGFIARYDEATSGVTGMDPEPLQDALELFQSSQMETVLLSAETYQISGPLVLDIENAAICVRIFQDFSLKLYGLNIDHQALRAMMYAAASGVVVPGAENLAEALLEVAEAVRNPVFDALATFSAATSSSGSFTAYSKDAMLKNDPMSRSNYASQFSMNPVNLGLRGGFATDRVANVGDVTGGIFAAKGPGFAGRAYPETDADLAGAVPEPLSNRDVASLEMLNRRLSSADFCKANQFASRDLKFLSDLLSLASVPSLELLKAHRQLLTDLDALKVFMIKARQGTATAFSAVPWESASASLWSSMLSITAPDVLLENKWDLSTSKAASSDLATADARIALDGLFSLTKAIVDPGYDEADLLDAYHRVAGMIEHTMKPVFDSPQTMYASSRFDVLSTETKVLLEGTLNFVSLFYFKYAELVEPVISLAALDAEVVGSVLQVRDVLDQIRDAEAKGSSPLSSLINQMKTFGDGVFLANGQAFLTVLLAAFTQQMQPNSNLLAAMCEPDFIATLLAPLTFKMPAGSGTEAALGRLLASDQTMIATPEEKMAFVDQFRAENSAFAASAEAAMQTSLRAVGLVGIEMVVDPQTGARDVKTSVPDASSLGLPMQVGDFLSHLVGRPSRVLQVSAVMINKARSMYHTLALLR